MSSSPLASWTFGRARAVALAFPFVLPLLFAAPACTSSDAPPAASAEPDAGACTSPEFAGMPLGVRCNALVDGEGRTALLHGVNARVLGLFDVTFQDGRQPVHAVPDFTLEDARRIRALGYNAVRLPVNWSGVEPTEDGGFSATYMDRLAQVIGFCEEAGVMVLISLHQDGYSKEIGQDGAPLWAIRPPPTKLLEGPLTNLDERILSDQVGAAFGTFFGETAEGAYLRGRYTKMVAHVIGRFAESRAVVGIDLFNEPVAPEDRVIALYKEMLGPLRAAAPKKLFFFEPSGARNIRDFAPIGEGSLGLGTVYAPHVYTAVFGANEERRKNITPEELGLSNERARAEADGYQAPLVIGEYGFYHAFSNFRSYIRGQQAHQEAQRASSFLWVWKELSQGDWGFFDHDAATGAWKERPAVISVHARVRVERASGRLVRVRFDDEKRELSLTILGDAAITAPNVLTIGETEGFKGGTFTATCDGKPVTPIETGAADPVSIPCGGAGVHTLVVRAR